MCLPVHLVLLMMRDITHLSHKITDSAITMHSCFPFIAVCMQDPENAVAIENTENLLEFLAS